MVSPMEIKREDIISVAITFCLLAIWFITLIVFNRPLVSVILLWGGMILLSIVYYFDYRNKQRNMKIFKVRFLVSAIPIYPALAIYVYNVATGTVVTGWFRFMPIGIVCTMLALNAAVVYYYTRSTHP